MQKTEQRVSCPEGLWFPLLYHSPPVSATTVHLILFIEEYSFSGGWSDSPRRKTANVLQKESSSTPNHPPSCCTTSRDLGGQCTPTKQDVDLGGASVQELGGRQALKLRQKGTRRHPDLLLLHGTIWGGGWLQLQTKTPWSFAVQQLCRFASQETGLGVLCPWSCHLDPRLGRLFICSAGPWEPPAVPIRAAGRVPSPGVWSGGRRSSRGPPSWEQTGWVSEERNLHPPRQPGGS